MNPEPASAIQERRQSLWLLTFSPAIWAVHFLLSYSAAALWCGPQQAHGGGTGPLQALVGGTALLALLGIGITARLGWRKHGYGNEAPPHDRDTPEDRHRFLGFATVLLSGLSAIATVYTGLSILLVGSCV
jgi:hypothetical protein